MPRFSAQPLRALALAGLAAASVLCAPSFAQVIPAPSLVNFQGRLTQPSGVPVPDANTYSITFSLWDAATGGTQKWNQTLTNVTVKGGVFSVLLTTDTPGLFNGANLWLQTQVGSDPVMTPRVSIASVPYALKANAVPDASIASGQLASDAVSLNKVSDGDMSDVFGNVGIGTPSPGYKLDVLGTGGVTRFSDGTRSVVTYLGPAAGVDGAFFGTTTEHPLIFQTNNSVNGIITSSGQWGIGTLTPTAQLQVNGGVKLNDNNVFEFGADVTKEANAGKIGYQAFSDGLDIVGAGTTTTNRKVKVYAEGGTTFTGEVVAPVINVLGGSDVAEPYDVAPAGGANPIPGMVVCIDSENVGHMKVANTPYSPTVAGIISGANGVQPGITLRQKGTIADGELPIASMGRVWALCDADAGGSIEPGDLLTSSATPGHAMKAEDRLRRDGAVIGKAMSSLKSGKGLVLVLVSLH